MRDKKKEPRPESQERARHGRMPKEWPLGNEKSREAEKDLPIEMRSRPPQRPEVPFPKVQRMDESVSSIPKMDVGPPLPVPKVEDTFKDRRCPLNSDSHLEHDKALFAQEQELRKLSSQVQDLDRQLADAETTMDLRFHNETELLKRRITELEGSQVVIPDGEKDRTSQVLAQRVYELQKQNAFLREKLKGKREVS